MKKKVLVKWRVLSFMVMLVFTGQDISFHLSLALAPSSYVKNNSANSSLTWFQFAESSTLIHQTKLDREELRREIDKIYQTFHMKPEEEVPRPLLLEDLEEADLSDIEGDLYVVSDTHFKSQGYLKGKGLDMGVELEAYRKFLHFLGEVRKRNGNLVINGDLLESYIPSKYYYRRLETIYSRLRQIKRVFYLPGNHDDAFYALIGKRWKNISFLESMSIVLKDKDVIHIEHGNQASWPWMHPDQKQQISSKGDLYQMATLIRGLRDVVGAVWANTVKIVLIKIMKQGVRLLLWLEDRGFSVRLWGVIGYNFFLMLCFPLQIYLLFCLDIRIRKLRELMEEKVGFKETKRPVWTRIFTVNWLYELRRLRFELMDEHKDEPTLHYVVGHFHELDLWIFKTNWAWLTTLVLKFLSKKPTRVKLYFTAGAWTLPLKWKKPLKYKLIKSDASLSRCHVADLIAQHVPAFEIAI